MKKSFTFLTLLILMIASVINIISVQAATDEPVLTLSTDKSDDRDEFDVTAVLTENTGIAGMLLTVAYDHEAMTLIGADRGPALSGLEYTTTNTDTEASYGAENFRFIWDGVENDTSTGNLLILHFRMKDGVTNGKYDVTFTYLSGSDVFRYSASYEPVYIDLAINPCTISVGTVNATLVVIISGAVIMATGALLLWMYGRRKRKITRK